MKARTIRAYLAFTLLTGILSLAVPAAHAAGTARLRMPVRSVNARYARMVRTFILLQMVSPAPWRPGARPNTSRQSQAAQLKSIARDNASIRFVFAGPSARKSAKPARILGTIPITVMVNDG